MGLINTYIYTTAAYCDALTFSSYKKSAKIKWISIEKWYKD